jgi:hypothetical protein
MKRFFWLALLACAVCPSCDAFAANESELTAYASILALTQAAEKNCTNTYASDAAMLILKDTNHITDKDDRALKTEMSKSKAALDRQIAADGAVKWCKSVLERYGPKGRIQHILITR